MDSLRGFEDEAAVAHAPEEEPALERPPEIGVDERRMHVRAYNYWVSLLDGRPYPSIRDIDPHTIEDFGGNSVLLDFTGSAHDPELVFLGRALRGECGVDQSIRRISQVPPRSLLSRLTDHYLQIIANRAPIGFEAEFVGQRGLNTLYRGILMPLSSDGESIDFIYGVINWKELADSSTSYALESEVDRAIAAAPGVGECPVWADGPNADLAAEGEAGSETPHFWPDEPPADTAPAIPADARLIDRLEAARHCAEQADGIAQRSRAALYRALGLAYDFALAAEREPGAYAELLAASGLKAQARAPMTPVAKLVFGPDYDKTRLTEFAAALSWARRQDLPAGSLAGYVESFEGGLKGIVQAERRARRPEPKADAWQEVRDTLRRAPVLAEISADVAQESGDFVLLLARREDDRLAILAPVSDERLVEQAIRKSAA